MADQKCIIASSLGVDPWQHFFVPHVRMYGSLRMTTDPAPNRSRQGAIVQVMESLTMELWHGSALFRRPSGIERHIPGELRQAPGPFLRRKK